MPRTTLPGVRTSRSTPAGHRERPNDRAKYPDPAGRRQRGGQACGAGWPRQPTTYRSNPSRAAKWLSVAPRKPNLATQITGLARVRRSLETHSLETDGATIRRCVGISIKAEPCNQQQRCTRSSACSRCSKRPWRCPQSSIRPASPSLPLMAAPCHATQPGPPLPMHATAVIGSRRKSCPGSSRSGRGKSGDAYHARH